MNHPAQEPDVVPGRLIALTGAGVIVATIAGVVAAYAIGSCRSAELGTDWRGVREQPLPAEVNAMEMRVFDVEAQGLDMHRRDEAFLASYGWVDRDREIVHVPIEVAYDLLLARSRGGGR